MIVVFTWVQLDWQSSIHGPWGTASSCDAVTLPNEPPMVILRANTIEFSMGCQTTCSQEAPNSHLDWRKQAQQRKEQKHETCLECWKRKKRRVIYERKSTRDWKKRKTAVEVGNEKGVLKARW